MGPVKDLGICVERLQAGFRAEINRPAAIFETRKKRRIGLAKFAPAECYKTRRLIWFI